MSAEKEIIVAFELGSSAIRGVAGRKEADGSIQILAIEQERISGSIRRGAVYNINKTTSALSRIKERLNNTLNAQITRAYVGVAGQSLHTVFNKVVNTMTTKEKITQEMIDNLMDENRGMHYTDSEILEVVPQEYHLGNDKTNEPIGIETSKIEGRYLNVIARTSLQQNIRRCMYEAGIEVIDIFITPLLLAKSLLPDTEKRSGCALVDIGAETTTVAIYRNNILRHLATIPLGGNNVTNDIAKIEKMEIEEAEEMKLKYGVAQMSVNSGENSRTIHISNDRTITEEQLQSISFARYDEIIQNVWNQITKDNWQNEMLSGITFTGQASLIPGLQEAMVAVSKFKNNQIKLTKELLPNMGSEAGVNSSLTGFNGAIALLNEGHENCVGSNEEVSAAPAATEVVTEAPATTVEEKPKEELVVEVKKPSGPSLMKRLGGWLEKMVNEGE